MSDNLKLLGGAMFDRDKECRHSVVYTTSKGALGRMVVYVPKTVLGPAPYPDRLAISIAAVGD